MPLVLSIFALVALYRNIQSLGIVKPAYMGNKWQNTYIVHTERTNWLGAKTICESNGHSMQFNEWEVVNWYTKTKAERMGWNTADDVWIGLIKHRGSHVWYEVRKDRCERTDVTYSGELFHETQCAVLNMSAGSVYAGNSHIIYADNCEGRQLGFICISHHGLIPTSVEMYPMTQVLERGRKIDYFNASSAEECAHKAFVKFGCYVATYFPEVEECEADCNDMDNILETVTLVNSTTNATALLRTYNKVLIKNTVTSLPSIINTVEYPCIFNNNLTTTDLSTSTYMTEQVTSECHCICPSTANVSSEVLLQRVNQLKEELTVTKTSLSSSVRKRTSAPDERKSSATMGIVGICIIVGTVFTLVAGDILRVIYVMIKHLKNRFK